MSPRAYIVTRTVKTGKRYDVRYTIRGRRTHQHWCTETTRRLAERARDYVNGELAVGRYPDPHVFREPPPRRTPNMCSDLYRNFGFAYMDVTATSWGMFATEADVPADLRRACVLTVASWLDRPVSDYAGQDFGVGGGGYRPSAFTGWPIPAAAHKLMSAYTVPVVG